MKFLRHSLVLLLSMLVFITSSGMTVHLHYCAGQLQNIGMRQETADCMMKMPVKPSCANNNSQKLTLKKVDTCCQDHQIKAKSDVKVTDNKAKDNNAPQSSFTAVKNYIVSFFSFSNTDDEKEPEKDDSLLPLLQKGLYILFQQFRN
ncbi:hypothetical protein N9R54_01690 [Pelobium sp.]|nr:hypothetical protein [Pelobium sp.]MDA9554922.1 hypothetical protein [Pelobium sp.]